MTSSSLLVWNGGCLPRYRHKINMFYTSCLETLTGGRGPRPKRCGGAKNTRSKSTDAMGDDARPGMREFYFGKRARRHDATPFEKCAQSRDAKAFQGHRPALLNYIKC